MKRRTIIGGALATIMAFTGIGQAQAETVWRFGWWGPATAEFHKDGIFAWGEQVEEVTEGRVKINFLAKPVGSPVAYHDFIRDGVIDAGYYIPGITKGRYVLHKAAEFPFLGNSAEANSVAYWRIYKSIFEAAGEHSDVEVLTVSTHGPGMIHNSQHPVESAADMVGLKLRVPGETIGTLAKNLGATPMFASYGEVPQLLSKGVADGVFLPFNAIRDLNLGKYQPYTTVAPGGIYNLVFHIAVNKDSWAAISEDDRTAIMSVSGEAGARLIGRSWDIGDAAGREYVAEQNVHITTMSPEFKAEIEAAFGEERAQWIKQANESGIDGEAALTALAAEVAKLNQELSQ